MIGLLQRVSRASIDVEGETIAAIGRGIIAFVCAEPGDNEQSTDRLLERLLGYRIFPDARDRMNLSVKDVGGALMLVPQFTLAADTAKGMRPSFSSTAAPDVACALFDRLVARARMLHPSVANGRFGANMQVSLINDGPVTFWLRAEPVANRE
ncbi:MAG: D-tyrosyl-tRNA(Tyr) deacylase [Betaproteobacteria bacterium RIFCSPLOWO2_12_FULL_63_13]|nr:MAG: D-tyrosyl-tRNA(Tyr) deacylase [Betaproteobacteria bacterium RIFCSPLOWO2_02_FULL_63_19]OGA50804.1 MAG: D-tyrosyl-tRNA(Tyr) deacylase [Betaproteobacteria bacterium RIFCSPLOWO2_12_FULL_63_13]